MQASVYAHAYICVVSRSSYYFHFRWNQNIFRGQRLASSIPNPHPFPSSCMFFIVLCFIYSHSTKLISSSLSLADTFNHPLVSFLLHQHSTPQPLLSITFNHTVSLSFNHFLFHFYLPFYPLQSTQSYFLMSCLPLCQISVSDLPGSIPFTPHPPPPSATRILTYQLILLTVNKILEQHMKHTAHAQKKACLHI